MALQGRSRLKKRIERLELARPTKLRHHERARTRSHLLSVGSAGAANNSIGKPRGIAGDDRLNAISRGDTFKSIGRRNDRPAHRHRFENLILDAARNSQWRDDNASLSKERTNIRHSAGD